MKFEKSPVQVNIDSSMCGTSRRDISAYHICGGVTHDLGYCYNSGGEYFIELSFFDDSFTYKPLSGRSKSISGVKAFVRRYFLEFYPLYKEYLDKKNMLAHQEFINSPMVKCMLSDFAKKGKEYDLSQKSSYQSFMREYRANFEDYYKFYEEETI